MSKEQCGEKIFFSPLNPSRARFLKVSYILQYARGKKQKRSNKIGKMKCQISKYKMLVQTIQNRKKTKGITKQTQTIPQSIIRFPIGTPKLSNQ